MEKLIVFLLAAALLIEGCFVVALPLVSGQEMNAESKIFQVKKGEGFFAISNRLAEEKIIANRFGFLFYAFLSGDWLKMKAGYYELNPSMGIRGIIAKLAKGDTVKIRITAPEGYNLKQIENLLISNLKSQISKPQFKFQNINRYKEGLYFLGDMSDDIPLEGFLFPDTYIFDFEASEEEIVKTFLKNFDDKLKPELRTEIKKQGKTVFEVITMASLIEKEVKTLEDKKIVSGILWKRIKAGMPLQVDASVLYAKNNGGSGNAGWRISLEDTKIDSRYNTYKYVGLPLGPICNPGMDSILAAIYPKESNYWYYLSKPNGETVFSRILDEHNVAKARYLK